MIEESEASRDVRRMVLIQARGSGAQTDAPRLSEGAGDEDLRHHDVFILHRVMLADPEFAESQLLGANDQLQVLVVTLAQRLGWVVVRHDEHPILDRLYLLAHLLLPLRQDLRQGLSAMRDGYGASAMV